MQLVGIVLWLVLAACQFFAFADGFRDWFDTGALVFGIAFAVCLVLGPFGGLVMAVVAFHGATEVWGWAWWQALMLVAPSLVLSVLVGSVSGLAGLLSSFGRSRQP